MKTVSFVILTWNSDKYITNCIESINTICNFCTQIIIVDNGSTDNTVNILNKYQENKNIEIVFLPKNYGTTKSRNIALNKVNSDTDYICILDSDTVINSNAIDILAEYLEKHPETAIVGPSMTNERGEKQIPYRKFPSWRIKILKAFPNKKMNEKGQILENYLEESITDEFECDYLISACWLMRYDIYKKLGGLDEKIFYSPEDVEYCMRAKSRGYKIVHLRKAKIIHIYQRISKKKLISKVNLSHLLGIRYVLKKYKKFLKEYRR